MSTATRKPRRGGKPDDGPRARFSQLLPYLLEHKKVLFWVVVLKIGRAHV